MLDSAGQVGGLPQQGHRHVVDPAEVRLLRQHRQLPLQPLELGAGAAAVVGELAAVLQAGGSPLPDLERELLSGVNILSIIQ